MSQVTEALIPAPIILFTFNRPEHTRRALESLAQNSEFFSSPLFIYCDGARNIAESALVEETRKLVREWHHPLKSVIERDRNWGLSKNIIDGVTNIVNKFGRIIVLEDDLVTSPYFLQFMNDGLRVYEQNDHVASIHGYVYPIDGLPETFFLKGADCWGWATWKDRWALFEPDGAKLLNELKSRHLTRRFDFNGAYPFTRMLAKQIAGNNDSWAIRWHASAFLKNKFTLYPGRSLAQNIGFDGSGTHCCGTGEFATVVTANPVKVNLTTSAECDQAYSKFEQYFLSSRSGLVVRLLRLLQKGLWGLFSAKKLESYYRRQMFFPEIGGIFINPFYFARKALAKHISDLAVNITGKTLDIGCGKKPYEKLFNSTQYIGLEFDTPENRASKNADFFYDGNVFPFPEKSFDSAICNQVLEHVFTPDQFITEINRVLKDQGTLLLTVPFVWDEHEQPFDYARYSSFGLKSLLDRNGFDVIEQRKSLADIRVIFQLINAYLYKITETGNRFINLLIAIFLMSPLNIMGVVLSKLLPTNHDLYLDNIVLAKKRKDYEK